MKTLITFENPYINVPPAERTRTTIDIANMDLSKLKRVHPGTIVQTTINILIRKLVDELERNGITEYAPDEYELAVANCSIALGGKHAVLTSAESTPTNADTGEQPPKLGRTAGVSKPRKNRSRSTKKTSGDDGSGAT